MFKSMVKSLLASATLVGQAVQQLELFAPTPEAPPKPAPPRQPTMIPAQPKPARPAKASKLTERQAYYDAMVEELKERYQFSIRKWRKGMSGAAYELRYRDGHIKRMLSAPRPRSSVSAAIFLHEVGHHAIGFRRYKPRCLEEYYVWQWAFTEMKKRNIELDVRVEKHYRRSMYNYVRLALRRGLKELPTELKQFLIPPE
ncbi:MAG: hypothetical protein WCJ97_11390 [Phycisphaerae bacterium]